MSLKCNAFLLVCAFLGCSAGQKRQLETPFELDDSFIEKKGDTPWLVMFYAPWCGHCRRLEPIWHQLHASLRTSEVRVGKLDSTRFGSVASTYDVRGYPTIKFIQGDRALSYRGERSKEALIQFTNRAHGPVVRWLPSAGRYNDARGTHSNEVFFMYVGPKDDSDFLKNYTAVSEVYRIQSYFYAGSKAVLPSTYTLTAEPAVIVVKDGQFYEYQAPTDGPTQESLDQFVNTERLLAFPRMTGGGMGELAGIDKRVFMVVTEETNTGDAQTERLKKLGETLALKHRDKYHHDYQFVWLADVETANSITMSRPRPPYILVLEPDSQLYFLPEGRGFNVDTFTIDDAHSFLEQVATGTSQAFGGTGIGQRVKRLFYDIVVTIYGIYNESPWLALLVFGVPSLVISVVCYALCCMEPIDEDAFYDENGDEREPGDDVEGGDDAEGEDMLPEDSRVRRRLVDGGTKAD